MKKILSIILSVLLVFGTTVVAFATENETDVIDPEYPLVVCRGMDFDGLTTDLGLETERNALNPIEAGDVISTLVKCMANAVKEGSIDGIMPPLMEYLEYVMGGLACDNNGNSVHNTTMKSYPLAIGNYPDYIEEHSIVAPMEHGIVMEGVDRYGADHVYYYAYDWRYSPAETCDGLAEMIELAKTVHGTDKVNLVCASMGGAVVDAYLYEYGTDSLNKCIFDGTVFCGTYVVTDLFQKKVLITGTGLEYFLYDKLGDNNFLVKTLASTGMLDTVADLAMKFVDRYIDYVYDNFLIDTFVTMPALWAIVLPDEFDSCIETMFPTEEDKAHYAEVIDQAYELNEMMTGMDDLLLSLPEKGVEVAVFAGYHMSPVPVYERSASHGDNVLESALMLGRARVANFGEKLEGDSDMMSPDKQVDLSTCLFPEYTWAIKDMPHVSCGYGTEVSDFLFWLVEFDGQPTVTSDPQYPQFMISSADERLISFE